MGEITKLLQLVVFFYLLYGFFKLFIVSGTSMFGTECCCFNTFMVIECRYWKRYSQNACQMWGGSLCTQQNPS